MSDTASASTAKKSEFGKFQSIVFPIHGYELKKFIPMSFLMFAILFVYTMVRDLKDVFIQKYAFGGGTELIPVLKLFFVMPAAFLAVMLFTVLVNKFGPKNSFYIIISIFIVFYALFLFVLFPNVSVIHPSAEQVRNLQESWPKFLHHVIPCVTNWSYTLFYIFSEIWGTMAISSLFWQFANHVTMKNEVKRFFGLYALIGNIGVILSGGALKGMSKSTGDEFTKNVKVLIGACIVFAFATMAIYYYINAVIMKDPKFYDPSLIKPKKKKEKVGMMEGIKFLFTSPYLMLICALVLAYGIGVNFLEVLWKAHMNATLAGGNQLADMMSNLSIITGILTIITTILGANVLRKLSWKTAAIVTPIVLFVLGGAFFALLVYFKMGGTMLFGSSVAILAVWVGLFADAISKSFKYCLFDSTKSMAYIPLDEDTRTKGQAAVEVIGGRAGKAGASAINVLLTGVIVAGSSIMTHLFTIIPIFAVTVIGWGAAVLKLSKKYEEKVIERESESR